MNLFLLQLLLIKGPPGRGNKKYIYNDLTIYCY